MHKVIFVPGLGDYNKNLPYLEKLWRKDGIDFHIHFAPWQEKEEDFEEKLARLVKKIDTLSKTGDKISLVGTSAGGSLVINAYAARKTRIHRLITVSARLLEGKKVFPPLSLASKGFPAFKDAVLSCEAIFTKTYSQRQRKNAHNTIAFLGQNSSNFYHEYLWGQESKNPSAISSLQHCSNSNGL